MFGIFRRIRTVNIYVCEVDPVALKVVHPYDSDYSDVGEESEHHEFSEGQTDEEGKKEQSTTDEERDKEMWKTDQEGEKEMGQSAEKEENEANRVLQIHFSQQEDEMDRQVNESNNKPPPPCSQSQAEAEDDMGGAENSERPPLTAIEPGPSAPQNPEEQDMADSEFEESDKEEDYMPHRMNDHTESWQGFRVSCFTDLPIEHVDSDDHDSDYIYSASSEEEGEPLGTKVKGDTRRHEFNEEVDMRDPKFTIGMTFPSRDSFKRALKEYSILKHRAVKLVKNDKQRVRAKCVEGCSWIVFALMESDGFSLKVKTFNDEHSCGLNFSSKRISSWWLAKR